MKLLFLQILHQLVNRLSCGNVDYGFDYFVKRYVCFVRNGVEVLIVENTDNVIDVTVVDGKSGVAGFGEGFRNYLLCPNTRTA